MFLRLCNEILSDLESDLLKIYETELNTLSRAEQSVKKCQEGIERLRHVITSQKFIGKEDEILFFKERKPRAVSCLIHHLNVYNIELNKPNSLVNYVREYFESELKKIKDHFDTNLEFYRYYRSGSTYLDELYFIRGKLRPNLQVESHVYDADPSFCTSHDFKVSCLLANEKLQDYLETELGKLDEPNATSTEQKPIDNTLKWTGSKTALTELMYGLYTTGVLNHGNASMKEIASFFESIFNIELGQFYRIYTELKIRQDQTRFLDDMKNALIRKMEDEDEKLFDPS